MGKIVVKLGGSNFKSSSDVNKIIKIVNNYNQSIVIVVSALYGVTNSLEKIIKKAQDKDANVNILLKKLKTKHYDFVRSNISDEIIIRKINTKLENQFIILKKKLIGINCFGEVPPSIYDFVISYGERLNSLILTEILEYNKIKSKEILPETLPLLTDGEFGNATVDYSLSNINMSSNFKEEYVYVIPGFYGISNKRKVTILGRGGTDYAAAAIANCLNAKSLDIWKDVDGFHTADPKLINKSQQIRNLSYNEAAELAYFGAKILHPRTVEPLKDNNIPIRIFNVNKADKGIKPLSIISSKKELTECVVKSVTYSDDFGILKFKGTSVGIKLGLLAEITSTFEHNKINIKSVITSQTEINLLLSLKDLEIAFDLAENLNISAISDIIAINDISVVAAVGEGIGYKTGIAGKLFSAVAKKNVNIKIISLGASPVVSYFIIDKNDKYNAVNEIHKEFFESSKTNLLYYNESYLIGCV